MRILRISDPAAPTPAESTAMPELDQERVKALEKVVKSIYQKMRDIEERICALEASSSLSVRVDPPPTTPAPTPVPTPAPTPVFPPVQMDAAAFKKNLFSKMWKHLND